MKLQKLEVQGSAVLELTALELHFISNAVSAYNTDDKKQWEKAAKQSLNAPIKTLSDIISKGEWKVE